MLPSTATQADNIADRYRGCLVNPQLLRNLSQTMTMVPALLYRHINLVNQPPDGSNRKAESINGSAGNRATHRPL